MIRIFLLCLALALPARAGPDRVSILLASHHVAARLHFEQVNPGVFLTWEDRAGGLDYTLGAYRNSFGRLSVTGIAAFPIWERAETQVAVFAGVANYPQDGRSYRFHAGDWVPLAGLQIRHRNLFVQIIPSDGRTARAVIAMGVTFRLGAARN